MKKGERHAVDEQLGNSEAAQRYLKILERLERHFRNKSGRKQRIEKLERDLDQAREALDKEVRHLRRGS